MLESHYGSHVLCFTRCQNSCIYCFKSGNGSCSTMQELTGQQCAPIRHIDIVAWRCDICRLYSLIKQWSSTSVTDHWSIHWLYQPLSLYSFTCMTLPHQQRPAYVTTLSPIYTLAIVATLSTLLALIPGFYFYLHIIIRGLLHTANYVLQRLRS